MICLITQVVNTTRYLRPKQSFLGSLFESLIAASFAAPTAIILNWYLLEVWGNQFDDPVTKSHYITISWLIFFFHSVIWKLVLRRLFEKHPSIEPKYIYMKLIGKENGS